MSSAAIKNDQPPHVDCCRSPCECISEILSRQSLIHCITQTYLQFFIGFQQSTSSTAARRRSATGFRYFRRSAVAQCREPEAAAVVWLVQAFGGKASFYCSNSLQISVYETRLQPNDESNLFEKCIQSFSGCIC